MIESIELANAATYASAPERMVSLSKMNFIFGANGVGKTTISRVIHDPAGFGSCKVNWVRDQKLQTLVYNRDFVARNFNASARVKGIFTLGEKDADNERAIEEKKKGIDALSTEIGRLNNTLRGPDQLSGKKGELAALDAELVKACWKQKTARDAAFAPAFEGVRTSKENFKDKVLAQQKSNTSDLSTLADLTERAETIYGRQPTMESAAPSLGGDALFKLEGSKILGKKVVGKQDVDIAAMINRLGNSDWIKQGLPFYAANEAHCPFCQQKVLASFEQSIAEYFDESFTEDTAAIAKLHSDYAIESVRLQVQLQAVTNSACKFLDQEKFAVTRAAIEATLSANTLLLERKAAEPSLSVTLQSTRELVEDARALVTTANVEVGKRNALLRNFAQEKQKLTGQVWKHLIDVDLKDDLAEYARKSVSVQRAIDSLTEQITRKSEEKRQAEAELKALEKSATSILPTIAAINALLKSFGFHSFTLAQAEGNHYKLARENGDDAQETLSEGEKSFVTFLYFYHLLKGSESESGISIDRVVVFDDPVSSLDADILFIVSSLIKSVFEEVRAGGQIKQVFVLTHNVYFHKEVTFNPDRRDKAMKEETFWVVRKTSAGSRLEAQPDNPIKTSYELLWAELRREPKNSFTIQNTLRRIVENYFKIFGGIDPKTICEKFEGREKMICASLFSWVNDGSHFVMDDLFVSLEPGAIDAYLAVFEQVFTRMGHEPHYKMMMGRE
ncbi:AAA family ATPase [Pseudoduganella sp. OTU4001]|uniref:AAA family ATPase n=1 Tax=Pseudoduganella sp. OTU4001 TaxID=3043854 RepID=UPI00313C6E9D